MERVGLPVINEPTALSEPELQREPEAIGGPRPGGGHFGMRARAVAALAVHTQTNACQEKMHEMRSAGDAARAFAPLAWAPGVSDAHATEDSKQQLAVSLLTIPTAVKGGRLVSLLGPQGAYSMFEPKGHGSASMCSDAPLWRTAEEVHMASISKQGRIIVVPRGTAKGHMVYRGHWVYDVKVHKESGWLEKNKARFVVDGSPWDLDWDTFSGTTPDEIVYMVIGYAAVHRHLTIKFDLSDACQM